jgi:hypothetical protein
MVGKALVASWRPYESGGGSHMRASQMESESVTVLDQVVLAQHPDGFWETFPLANCSIIWTGKPTVTVVQDGQEVLLSIDGKDNTIADELAQGSSHKHLRFSMPSAQSVGATEEIGLV